MGSHDRNVIIICKQKMPLSAPCAGKSCMYVCMYFCGKGQRSPVGLLVLSPLLKMTAGGGGEGSIASRQMFPWPLMFSTQSYGSFQRNNDSLNLVTTLGMDGLTYILNSLARGCTFL